MNSIEASTVDEYQVSLVKSIGAVQVNSIGAVQVRDIGPHMCGDSAEFHLLVIYLRTTIQPVLSFVSSILEPLMDVSSRVMPLH